jgi:60 kDa SS-A/Ro ribonucleoprotein
MANKNVFKSGQPGKAAAVADTTNKAGGAAYKLGEKAALAQYAATGTFNDTFYSEAEVQVSEVLDILEKVDVEFIGKVVMYARTDGRMKDMPALLCAHLSTRGNTGLRVLKQVFPVVIDNGKMLRNFVQIMKSGVVGRKSLGTAPKNLIAAWFASRSPADIFKMSIGNDPTMGDVLYLSRSSDLGSPERRAFYAYMLDKEHDFDSLPPLVKEYELLRKREPDPKVKLTSLPKVPMEMLMGLQLNEHEWGLLAEQMSWTQIRMNLNTLSRHGVFKKDSNVKMVAAKLSDTNIIEKVKPFPYQLFTTYLHTSENGEEAVPIKIRNALHDALEISTKNVPTFEGRAFIAVDTSGSMRSSATGYRNGATSVTRCIDVASLIACTFLKKNRESVILPFDTSIHLNHGLNPNDSVMTNADKLRKFGGGGTDCGLALHYLNQNRMKGDLVLYVSDNESWFDAGRTYGFGGGGTSMANEWAMYKAANPKAKLVCIDLQQDDSVQVKSDGDVLNIGGFSDSIWEIIKKFVEGVPSADYWVDTIEKIQLPMLPAKA